MVKSRYRYYLGWRNPDDETKFNIIHEGNSLWWMQGEAERLNMELRQRLGNMKIGRKVIKNRFKILRKMKETTTQIALNI